MGTTHRTSSTAFTIVELLIVVVVIAVLATITVVTYNGIAGRATEAAIKSDLSSSAKKLESELIRGGSGVYPTSLTSAAVPTRTDYTYDYRNYGKDYCLQIQKGTAQFYIGSRVYAPQAGVCPNNFVSTVAGSSTSGYADGTGSSAQFADPAGVASDSSGNAYIADGNAIRKVTTSGVVTTLAGSANSGAANGTGAAAQFYDPNNLAVDGAGNVYVADSYNYRIRKITPAGVVTTLAGSTYGFNDGTGTAAQFSSFAGIAVDSGGTVYVADTWNNRIRKVTPAGVVTTIAGQATAGYADGTGAAAQFQYPQGIAIDSGGTLYVADTFNHRIRKVTQAGVVTTFLGNGDDSNNVNGTGTGASLGYPAWLALDSSGNVYFVSNQVVRKSTPAGVVTDFVGSNENNGFAYADGYGSSAKFDTPKGVAVTPTGAVYIIDSVNYRLRKAW